MHWPFPLNPNGNHPLFPTLPDGTRDHDDEWDIKDTWKQLEAVQRSGAYFPMLNLILNSSAFETTSERI